MLNGTRKTYNDNGASKQMLCGTKDLPAVMKRKSESLALGSTFALYTEKIPAYKRWRLEASSNPRGLADVIFQTETE